MQFLSSLFASAVTDGLLPEGMELTIGSRTVKVVKKLGEGGYATVYLATDTKSGERFAVKHSKCQSEEQRKQIMREIEVMREVGMHPNIVAFYGFSTATSRRGLEDYFVLMEHMPSSLLEVVSQQQSSGRPFAERTFFELILDIARALSHLHSLTPPLAHSDIKIENVLATRTSAGGVLLKLCDFGSVVDGTAVICDTTAKMAVESERIERLTTAEYRAPEMVDLYSRKPLSTAVDLWALGVVAFAAAFFKQPFADGSKMAILSAKYSFPPAHKYSKKVSRLIKLLLDKEPMRRPTAAQICNHVKDILSGGKGTLKKGRKKKAQSFAVSSPTAALLKVRRPPPTELMAATPVSDIPEADDEWDDVFADAADASEMKAKSAKSDRAVAGVFWNDFGHELVDEKKSSKPMRSAAASKKDVVIMAKPKPVVFPRKVVRSVPKVAGVPKVDVAMGGLRIAEEGVGSAEMEGVPEAAAEIEVDSAAATRVVAAAFDEDFDSIKAVPMAAESDLKRVYRDKLKALADMGFSEERSALAALRKAKGDVTLAVHLLVSQ